MSSLDILRSRFFVIGIARGYGLDGPGSIPGSARFFSSLQRSDRLWSSPSLLSNVYRGLFSRGVKQPRREADHLSPASAEVKSVGAVTPHPHTSSWRGA
jgi:hypothetical protein